MKTQQQEKENKNNRKSFLWIIFKWIIILIGIIAIGYSFSCIVASLIISHEKDEVEVIEETVDDIDYTYLDQFIMLINTEVFPRESTPEEVYKEQYKIWYTNKGYSDIIIDKDNRLSVVNDDVSIFDILPEMDEVEEGIYNFYGNGFSLIVSVEYLNDKHDSGFISLSGYSSSGEQIGYVSDIFVSYDQYDFNNPINRLYDSSFRLINYPIAFYYEEYDSTLQVIDQREVEEGQILFQGEYEFVFPYVYE